jgi:8-oxo-dGTP diphosphatase
MKPNYPYRIDEANDIVYAWFTKMEYRGGAVTFPGRHIEKEESFVQGIKREILEETGLTIYNVK